jgi:hypothetical protein
MSNTKTCVLSHLKTLDVYGLSICHLHHSQIFPPSDKKEQSGTTNQDLEGIECTECIGLYWIDTMSGVTIGGAWSADASAQNCTLLPSMVKGSLRTCKRISQNFTWMVAAPLKEILIRSHDYLIVAPCFTSHQFSSACRVNVKFQLNLQPPLFNSKYTIHT